MNYRAWALLAGALFLQACGPSVSETTPDFDSAEIVLSFNDTDKLSAKTAEIEIEGSKAILSASSYTTSGADITFADNTKYDIYPWEAYFGTTEIRFSRSRGIIYTVVLGGTPVGGDGTRVFEFSTRDRKLLRDYYIKKH